MVGNQSSRVVDFRWNHRDPMVGSPEISPRSFRLPSDVFSPPLTTTAHLSSWLRSSPCQRPPKLLGWHVPQLEAEKIFVQLCRGCCREKKKNGKKKRKRRRSTGLFVGTEVANGKLSLLNL